MPSREEAIAAAAPGTSSSAASARCRSRRSPRSTARASAAGSRSRCTATRARSRRAVRHFALPGVLPRDHPRLGRDAARPAARRPEDRGPRDRREPAAPEQDARRGPRRSSWPRRPPARAGRVRRRVDRVRARARRAGAAAARAAPTRATRPRSSARARAQLDDAVHGAAPAPYRALDLIEGAAALDARRGLPRRGGGARRPPAHAAGAGLALRVRPRRAPRQERRRRSPTPSRASVRKVGIVGAGLMATPARDALPPPPRGADRDPRPRRRRRSTTRARLDPRGARRTGREGPLRGRQGPLPRRLVTGTTGYEGFEDCDLVLEAVFEEIVGQAAGVRRARGASSARLHPRDEHVVALGRPRWRRARPPGALVGMHFFNPVAVMPLVELVAHAGDRRRGARDRVRRSRRSCGKRPVLVARRARLRRQPVLTRMTSVLMDALEHGNTVEETDEAVLRLGLPMAPSVLLQMVGPRVANHVLETMHAAYPTASRSRRRSRATPTAHEIVVAEERAASGRGDHATPCSKRSPTRSRACSTRASSGRPPTSTRA